jgi:cell division protein FtsI/penicillin-binding protein 2
MRPRTDQSSAVFSVFRLRVWYGLILVCFLAIGIKLFYMQIIRHDYYKAAAYEDQFKQYKIPAERGAIYAHDGSGKMPLVLNQDTFTLFADPKFIEDPNAAAGKVVAVIGGSQDKYAKQMRLYTRYVVLKKRIGKQQKDELKRLNIKGLGIQTEPIRTYPQGNLAAQLLGFVNDEGEGNYGVEQALNGALKGKDGELEAITDAQGVPLVSTGSDVLREAESGQDLTLTIDINMQRQIEQLLKPHLESVNAKSGSVIVMDPYSGAVKAMANYPAYNPAKFYEVEDASLFTNPAVSAPLEVGSIMKSLTVAAGLNEGVIKPNTTFFDPAAITIDGHTIKNVEEDGGAATRTIPDILRYSLNTGAVYIMQQLGGGKINEKARLKWHDYLTNKYGFGQKTGIEQGYEAEGSTPDPKNGFGLNLQYANSSFGQGITITPLQMLSAYISTINGGTYYRPHLVEPAGNEQSLAVRKNVIKPDVSKTMRELHQNSAKLQYPFVTRDGYQVGGKTGTAEIPGPNGGYRTDVYNGTFIGFIGGDKPEYAIMVRVDEPHVAFYAGTAAAAPLFAKTLDVLINNFSIRPAGGE